MRNVFKFSAAISILLSACGGGDPEQEAVDAFFGSAQRGDRMGIERVSLVGFDNEVASWEIVERGEESEGPFELAALEKELAAKRDEVRDQRDANARFVSDNLDTYDAYKAKYADDPNAPFEGELAAFHEELQQRQKQLAQLEADADQLALDVEALRDAATLSLSTPVDTRFEGVIKVKPLQVRVNNGSTDETYTVVLHRYELVDTGQNRTPTARWIVGEVLPSS